MNLPNSRRLYIFITDAEVLLFAEADNLSSDLRPIDGGEVLSSTFRVSWPEDMRGDRDALLLDLLIELWRILLIDFLAIFW